MSAEDLYGTKGRPLARMAQDWQADAWLTPIASDDGRKATAASHQAMLMNQAAAWPTPNAGNFNDGEDLANWESRRSRQAAKHGNNGFGMPLSIAAQFQSYAPHPQMHDGWTSLTPIPFCDPPSDGSISGPLLAEISVYRRWSQRSGGAAGWRGTWTRRPRRQLNVRFAEYLMGWPPEWTACASPATAYTRWLSAMRGLLSTLCSQTPDQPTLL